MLHTFTSQNQNLGFSRKYDVIKIVSNYRELSIICIQWFLERFGINPKAIDGYIIELQKELSKIGQGQSW